MTKNAQEVNVLAGFSTEDLVNELKLREGVQAVVVMPYEPFSIVSNTVKIKDTGPAILFVVID
jgi:hypothetical protein